VISSVIEVQTPTPTYIMHCPHRLNQSHRDNHTKIEMK